MLSVPADENVFPVEIYILIIKRSDNEIKTLQKVFL